MEWLEQTVSRGTKYLPGQTIQMGWSLFQIRESDDGLLSLWEPDFGSSPIVWIEGVSRTLAHVRLHKDVVESVLPVSEMTIPSLREAAIVCTRLSDASALVLDRQLPEGQSSGWFFGCADRDHNHHDKAQLRLVSLYDAVVTAPRTLPYLALPAGTFVILDASQPHIHRHDAPLPFRAGSYLAALHPQV